MRMICAIPTPRPWPGGGRICSRTTSGTCRQHQRDIAVAAKNARELALLPDASIPERVAAPLDGSDLTRAVYRRTGPVSAPTPRSVRVRCVITGVAERGSGRPGADRAGAQAHRTRTTFKSL
jgi:hypothetical protein